MILGGSYGTVADIEIMWTLIALFGLIFSLYNVREAFRDVHALETNKIGNGRQVIAKAFRLSEVTRFVKQAIFLSIGILSMITPSAPQTAPTDIRIIYALITWGLIVAAILTAYQSYLGYRMRIQIKRGAYDNTTHGHTTQGALDDHVPNGATIQVEGTIAVKDDDIS